MVPSTQFAQDISPKRSYTCLTEHLIVVMTCLIAEIGDNGVLISQMQQEKAAMPLDIQRG